MKIKSILIFIGLAFLLLGCEKEPFPEIELPIHPKAINPKKTINSPVEGAKGVAYYIDASFPADNVVEFYDKKMNQMGFIPYLNDRLGPRRWESFSSKSGKFEPTENPPGRYLAHWVDKAGKTRIWLAVFYKYDRKNEKWASKPLVSINIAEFDLFRK